MNHSSKFKIFYSKDNTIDYSYNKKKYENDPNDLEYNYNPFYISKTQLFNPIYNLFFTLNQNNYNKISLNHKYHICNYHTIKNIETKEIINKDIFIKYSPIIDPSKYLIGKYENDNIEELPKLNSIQNKLSDKNNASYVDNFFYYLTSRILHNHSFINGIDYYGSYLCIQDIFKYNITDELEYFQDSAFFNNNINKLFKITNIPIDTYYDGTKNYRQKLNLSNDYKHNITCDSLPNINNDTSIFDLSQNGLNLLYNKNNSLSSHNTSKSDSECNYSSNSDDNNSVLDSSEWETDSNTSISNSIFSCDDNYFAYINNFPVQSICLEKCDGTLDTLLENKLIDDNTGSATLFQIIMSLICFQNAFQFTHNDLHTNNIMFVNTDKPYLFYKYNNIVYRVPTYNKIFKIIDFGRSIYKYNSFTFCSDSFSKDGDANSQYNCEPFFNSKKPRLEPNFSFDLCRLGCSIYDFIEDINDESFTELKNTVDRWCTDDNNKNILYKKNGEERYPDFKLYKMIARTVHNHTPEKQLDFTFFNQYKWDKNVDENLIDLDIIPCYV